MVNILNILQKVSKLSTRIFYSPLYGNTRVKIYSSAFSDYRIWIYPVDNDNLGTFLTDYGTFYKGVNGECLLFPSKSNKNWEDYKIPMKNLPEGTPVMVSDDKEIWELQKYLRNACAYTIDKNHNFDYKYIVPTSKFNFETREFDPMDNYGLLQNN